MKYFADTLQKAVNFWQFKGGGGSLNTILITQILKIKGRMDSWLIIPIKLSVMKNRFLNFAGRHLMENQRVI